MSTQLLLRRQLEQLADYEWVVVAGDELPDPPEGITPILVPMRREPALSDLRALVALYRLFRRERFAFVQTHTPKASLLALPAARLAGLPTIYTVHGALWFRGNGRLANAAGWVFERWCCTWAGRVVVQSREDHASLPRGHICRATKLGYIGNGVDLERFTEAPPPSNDPPVVLMISRLVVEKGCEDFFAVAARLRGRARFVHIGPPEHDQRDAIPPDRVALLAQAGTVEFVGAVADVVPHIAAADIVLLPSYREGIPRAAMEAAAMGRPVVAYDVRGVREVIPPETGLLAPRGDIDHLVGVVTGLIDDAARRRALGIDVHDHVHAHFSEDAVVERLRAQYATLGR